MGTIRRATLATKLLLLLLPAAAALALALAWTAMAPAQNGVAAPAGHVGLRVVGVPDELLFRGIVQMTTEAVPGDKRDQPRRPSVVLRRGLSASNEVWTWHAQVRAGDPAARRDATLTWYDTQNSPVVSWELTAARPTKIETTTLNASGNEVAIETVELAAERLDIDP